MRKQKYRYMVYDVTDQNKMICCGSAKAVGDRIHYHDTCIHKAARKGQILNQKYFVIREEIVY